MRSILTLAYVTVLTACVSTNATLLDTSVQPAKLCPAAVKVYLVESDVPPGYTKVALLKSKGDDDFTSESGMVNSQRKKAASLGANGIILGVQKDASTGAKIASAFLGTSQNRKGEAVAILVPADTASAHQRCQAAVK